MDGKAAVLAASGVLNSRPEAVTDPVFCSSVFFDAHDLVQVKYEMVRRVRVDGVPVARAAAAFGFSGSLLCVAAALDTGGPAALVPGKPGPKGPRKLTEAVMARSRACGRPSRVEGASVGRGAVREEFGLVVHPRSIERALARRREARARRTFTTPARRGTAGRSGGVGPAL